MLMSFHHPFEPERSTVHGEGSVERDQSLTPGPGPGPGLWRRRRW